jgi:small-conductance mechanosensitive channel
MEQHFFQAVDLTTMLRYGSGELLLELGLLLAALGSALGLTWLMGRRHTLDSVWFGRRLIDGVLFPVVALVAVYMAYRWKVDHPPVLGLLVVAVPVLATLAVIRLFARVIVTAFPASAWAKVVERFLSWAAWLTVMAWLTGLAPFMLAELDQITFHLGKNKISARTIIDGVLACGFVLALTLWISKLIEKRLLQTTVQDLSLRKVMGNTIRAGMLLLGGLVTLSIVGVDLTALSVLGGALGVGLGFGLQKLAANYVSGFVVLLERSLRIGDNVKVDGFEGVVVDIKTRYTLVRAGNGRESVVPNEMLITQRVENLSLGHSQVLLQVSVLVAYGSDAVAVKALLESAALGCARVLADPPPVALLERLTSDGLAFNLHFWIADPHNGQGNVVSDVNFAVLATLQANGISIPYPQRMVHVQR